GETTAAHRAVALRRCARVAMENDDVVEVRADGIGGHLGEGRLLPLAVRRDAGRDGDRAAGLDADGRALVRPETTDLDIGGDADAEVAALLAKLRLLLADGVVVDQLYRAVECLVVVAAVVLTPGEGVVRKLVRLDKVAAPDLHR